MDEVSSYGYAWGYLGFCIPFLIALIAYVLGPDMVGVLPDSVSKIIGFGVTALWWLIVTLPLLKGYRQKNYVETKAVTVGQTFGKIFGTLKKIAVSDRKVFFFLIGFFLYIDGVGCFQGSIQSLSRSYYSKIIPAENSGEYFGIYDIFAKGASFLGSAVIAAVKLAGGTINVAVACLAIFFALGFVFLKIADRQPMAGER